ncbi:hypothetical protein [Brassicibacter mesophilus]|jgi:hypothetical protein|uniref:hypothetical protein n=1 Tax=Brassicibacter mesophilus TaxID=745119 RepID=UPI003D1F53ED
MNKKYTVFKDLVLFIVFLIIVASIIKSVFGEYFWIIYLFGIVCSFIIFNDYKIVIYDEEIEFYSLFRKIKVIKLDDIDKIEIGEIRITSAALGSKRNMYIYINDEKYTFNIDKIENENFYNDMKKLSEKYKFIYAHVKK